MTRTLTLVSIVILPWMATAAQPRAAVKGVEARIEKECVEFDLSLALTGTRLADFDMQGSSISKFVSDKGDDLGAKPEGTPDYATMPIYAACLKGGDDTSFTITVQTPHRASEGASQLTLEGVLKLTHSPNREQGQVKNVKVQNDAELTFAGIKGRITQVKRSDVLDFTVEFPDLPAGVDIKDLKLKDDQGEDLRGSRTTQKTRIGNGPETMTISFYRIKPPVDVLTLDYDVWLHLEEMTIPFNVSAGKGGASASIAAKVPHPPPPAIVAPPKPVAQPGTSANKEPPKPPNPASVPVAGLAWPVLKITGVMGKGQNRSAIINGEIVGVGEEVSGVLVQGIAGDSVTLKFNSTIRKARSGDTVR